MPNSVNRWLEFGFSLGPRILFKHHVLYFPFGLCVQGDLDKWLEIYYQSLSPKVFIVVSNKLISYSIFNFLLYYWQFCLAALTLVQVTSVTKPFVKITIMHWSLWCWSVRNWFSMNMKLSSSMYDVQSNLKSFFSRREAGWEAVDWKIWGACVYITS